MALTYTMLQDGFYVYARGSRDAQRGIPLAEVSDAYYNGYIDALRSNKGNK